MSKISKTLERTLLKSLLPSIITNTDWQKWINLLGRATSVTFEKRQTKEKKPKCIVCAQPYDNYLLLVFHLELIHKVVFGIFRNKLKCSSMNSNMKQFTF
jgi:hypothetical protein